MPTPRTKSAASAEAEGLLDAGGSESLHARVQCGYFVAEWLIYFEAWALPLRVAMNEQPPGYSRVTDAVAQLKAIFLEIPGTRLTVGEASRLSGVDLPACGIILGALTDAGFLKQRVDGLFIRRGTDSPGS